MISVERWMSRQRLHLHNVHAPNKKGLVTEGCVRDTRNLEYPIDRPDGEADSRTGRMMLFEGRWEKSKREIKVVQDISTSSLCSSAVGT